MSGAETIEFSVGPERISIAAGDRPVGSYIYQGCWRPYFWPLCTPEGSVVRGVSAREHPNQYGVSLAYGGHQTPETTSIWSDYDEPPYGPCGKMLHRGFNAVRRLDARTLLIAQQTVWVNGRGEVFGGDVREHELVLLDGGELLLRIRQRVRRPGDPVPGNLLLSARVADSIRVKALYNAEGHVPGEIRNSEGAAGEEATRDTRARWCSYWGRVGDGHAGLALLSHPLNPEHPARFFTREYGIVTINQPFNPKVDELVVRWGAFIFRGPADPGRIDRVYQEFAQSWR